jgi:hypothetical protein
MYFRAWHTEYILSSYDKQKDNERIYSHFRAWQKQFYVSLSRVHKYSPYWLACNISDDGTASASRETMYESYTPNFLGWRARILRKNPTPCIYPTMTSDQIRCEVRLCVECQNFAGGSAYDCFHLVGSETDAFGLYLSNLSRKIYPCMPFSNLHRSVLYAINKFEITHERSLVGLPGPNQMVTISSLVVKHTFNIYLRICDSRAPPELVYSSCMPARSYDDFVPVECQCYDPRYLTLFDFCRFDGVRDEPFVASDFISDSCPTGLGFPQLLDDYQRNVALRANQKRIRT